MSNMNEFQKLAVLRRKFRENGIKKSGINLHAEFQYFELSDIIPAASEITDELNTIFLTDFYADMAIGTFVDIDTCKTIVFRIPMRSIAEPAKFRMNEAQARGAEITYYTRYLYYMLLGISNQDELDSDRHVTPAKQEKPVAAAEAPKPEKKKKPATKQEREVIKQELTATDEPATEMQLNALRNALNALLDRDPDQEEFVQQIAAETNGLLDITKNKAEEIIFYLGQLMESYTDA